MVGTSNQSDPGMAIPICSMYGIFTYIYPKNYPNVGKYSIHGASGIDVVLLYIEMTVIHRVVLTTATSVPRDQCDQQNGDGDPEVPPR